MELKTSNKKKDMIKEKLTPEFRIDILKSIKKTVKNGREHGFFMCLNKNGKLYAAKECEGDTCSIDVKISQNLCPIKNQGFFHVHPITKFNISRKNFELMTNTTKKMILGPSHVDVLTALNNKCEKLTEGTICTATDLELQMDCWTPKKGAINPVTCYYGKKDLVSTLKKDLNRPPKKWSSILFDKETIDL